MKTLFTLLAGFMLVTSQAVAQTTTTTTTTTTSSAVAPASAPEKMDMLASAAELKNYALSEVAAANSFVWGPSILTSVGEVRSLYVAGDVDEVIGKLMLDPSNKFKFKIRDASTLNVYASLTNEDGDGLFNSYTDVTPFANPNGGFSISPALHLYMNWTIPVKFPGAQYARIEHIDPNTGESWTVNLNVSNGKIYFPAQYAGRGTLIVGRQYPNGNTPAGYDLELAYTLKDGLLIQSKVLSGQASYAGIENYEYANDKFMAPTGPLMLNTNMAPPAKDQWSSVSPPTGAIKLETTPVGTSRQFKVTVSFACEPSLLGNIEAYIYDPDTVDSEGFVNEYPGIVNITQQTNGNGTATTVVSVTWTITNNGIKASSSKWRWRFESAGFNKQSKPSRPYYGNSSDNNQKG